MDKHSWQKASQVKAICGCRQVWRTKGDCGLALPSSWRYTSRDTQVDCDLKRVSRLDWMLGVNSELSENCSKRIKV